MEEDRLETNLGPSLDDQIESEVQIQAKQPKRRFIGRRAADQAAQNKITDASIEDSGAIQGVNHPVSIRRCILLANFDSSCATSTSSTGFEQYPTRNSSR
jgi:hypothetical protein